ncbi:hypothetical protein BAZSYMA_ACONTIG17517_1 [Bathymodiolus azoricus thioautotrophic gill symbiont]|uniref:Uncharacterized protein n=1 Tax=Bathymodiolus azoricus thioautotrophic gill symbiont TaxID=235205 RepID=A0A1H6MI97_9GAMM|nr:hypothetical protein BAZSYMA_ACONTIG17517_1 [Bathymodiolus azoricus thioautotrophic gill symbiont]
MDYSQFACTDWHCANLSSLGKSQWCCRGFNLGSVS